MTFEDEFFGIKVWSILSLVSAFVFALAFKVFPPSNYEPLKELQSIFVILQGINAFALIFSLYRKMVAK